MDSIKRLTSRQARMHQLRRIYRNRTKSSFDIYSTQNYNSNEHSNMFESTRKIDNEDALMNQLLGNENNRNNLRQSSKHLVLNPLQDQKEDNNEKVKISNSLKCCPAFLNKPPMFNSSRSGIRKSNVLPEVKQTNLNLLGGTTRNLRINCNSFNGTNFQEKSSLLKTEDQTPTTSIELTLLKSRAKLDPNDISTLSRKANFEPTTPTSVLSKEKCNSAIGKTNYTKFKIQPKKLLTKMIKDRLESQKEIPMIIGDKIYNNIDVLISYLQKDELKFQKELEVLSQNFQNLIKEYKQSIERKYKIISCKISKLILQKNSEILLHKGLNHSDDVIELINQLESSIASCKRDQSNFDYQFSFFKSRITTIHNECTKKLPDISIDDLQFDTDNEEQNIYIKQSLQFLTGIVFENSVPLSQGKTLVQIQK